MTEVAKLFNLPSAIRGQMGASEGGDASRTEPPDNGGMDMSLFATKADMSELRSDMRIGFAELRADMHKADSEHKKWILTTVLSVIGTGVAVAGFLFGTLRDKSPAAPQQAPIIINVPSAPAAPAAPAK